MTGISNRLMQSLSPSAYEALLASSHEVDLPIRAMLFRPSSSPTHVHFLTAGLASLVVTMPEGASAEVGMTGSEGIIGTAALFSETPMESACFMQISGTGLRIPMKAMRALFDEIPEIRRRILEFLQSQINVSAQLSACNKLHEAEARLARWLLMASDRAQTETLNLTQEFLAEMLGSQRSTVALVAGSLQRSGFISYRHGVVQIVDRSGLSEAACDCYPVICKIVSELYS